MCIYILTTFYRRAPNTSRAELFHATPLHIPQSPNKLCNYCRIWEKCDFDWLIGLFAQPSADESLEEIAYINPAFVETVYISSGRAGTRVLRWEELARSSGALLGASIGDALIEPICISPVDFDIGEVELLELEL